MHSLSCTTCESSVVDRGAHLLTWAPTDQPPVLWISARPDIAPDASVHSGVPAVFPWFGSGVSGDMTPSHGFARTAKWKQMGIAEGPTAKVAVFQLDQSKVTSPLFPGAYRATYAISAGPVLDLALTIENTGDQEFTYEEALHTYLHVSDVRQVRVEGLDGATYLDKLNNGTESTQSGDITFTGETDRVYRSTSVVRVVDPGLGRVIHVRKISSASTIVWNPWEAKAATMNDITPDDWTNFVCIEGGNVGTDAITLQPEESHTMRYRLRVESL
jgi:glucose-6-phosphate 1-epimerase